MVWFDWQNPYSKRLIIELSIILSLVFLVGGLIIWLGGDLAGRATLLQEKKQQLALRSLSLQSLASLKTDAARARTFSSLLENILPLKDQLIHFPKDIEELARRAGVEFGSTFGEEKAAGETEAGHIAFIFSVGGSYDKIMNFMREVERGRYVVQWMAVDLSERSGVYRGTISGRVFSRN